MPVATYTKTGNKATITAKLDKNVFGVEVNNHDLLKQAYLAYQANGRANLAVVKKRGEVRGGGRKPWRQKGTGRARAGSSRSPIWRGGGITFGPTGHENYSIRMTKQTKKTAIRQALSLASQADKIKVIEVFEAKDGKVGASAKLLDKINASGNVLLVVDELNDLTLRSTNNLPGVKLSQAKNINVFDVLNADQVIISQKSLPVISDWLTTSPKEVK